MYEKTYTYPKGRIEIRLEYDTSADSPDEMGDCEPEFFLARNGVELERKLNAEFETPRKAVRMLTSGKVFEDPEGNWYYGFSEYRHGQSAFAFCGSARARNWPDHLWDVIPFVGWVKISKKLREDWGIGDEKDKALSNAEGTLREWEAYLNGEVYGYIVEVFDENDKPLDEESCWGYYGDEDAISDAQATARYLAGKFWQKLGLPKVQVYEVTCDGIQQQ